MTEEQIWKSSHSLIDSFRSAGFAPDVSVALLATAMGIALGTSSGAQFNDEDYERIWKLVKVAEMTAFNEFVTVGEA